MLHTERLKQLRKQADLTQEEVARTIGTSRTNYVRYERGHHQPPNDMLDELADLFHVSIDYLLGRTDDPTDYEAPELQTDFAGDAFDHLLEVYNGDVAAATKAKLEAERRTLEEALKEKAPPTLEEVEEAYFRALIDNGYISKDKRHLTQEEMRQLSRWVRKLISAGLED